jgi:hypothetical protein
MKQLQAEGVLEGIKAAKAKAQHIAVERRQAAKSPPAKRRRTSSNGELVGSSESAGGGGGGGAAGVLGLAGFSISSRCGRSGGRLVS